MNNLSRKSIPNIKTPLERTLNSLSYHTPKKGKKLLFDDEAGRQLSDEVSQMKLVGALGGETLADKDMTAY